MCAKEGYVTKDDWNDIANGRDTNDWHEQRLKRALEARRLAVEAYGNCVRAGIGTDNVAAWCRETDVELTAAMVPFLPKAN
jgi:hypothetical protein